MDADSLIKIIKGHKEALLDKARQFVKHVAAAA
jgi:hypothetical protein